MITARQSVAQAAAELMKQRRKQDKEMRKERAVKIAAFEKAGGFALSVAQIRGALLPTHDRDRNFALWESSGQAEIAREEAEAAKPKQGVLIVFPDGGKGPRSAEEMRPLKWSAIWKGWEGNMNIEDARKLALALDGAVKGDDVLPLVAAEYE